MLVTYCKIFSSLQSEGKCLRYVRFMQILQASVQLILYYKTRDGIVFTFRVD